MTTNAVSTAPKSLDYAAITRCATALRALSADMVEQANSGHPGLPLGMADTVAVLFRHFLRYNPKDAAWPNRDRFVLSAGHGSALLYATLHLAGYDLSMDDLKSFRQLHSPCAGHPEVGEAPGIETTTGPLGQGLANAVGLAIGQKIAQARYGADVCDHHTYVIAGDGCLMEGISQEAISMAGHHVLDKLVVIFDNNGITIDGSTDLSCSDDTRKRFEASNWDVFDADGHDADSLYSAIAQAKDSGRPALIICTTTIGKFCGEKAGTEKCHGSPLGKDGIATLRENIGWNAESFTVSDDYYNDWKHDHSGRGQAYSAWQKARKALSADVATAYEAFLTGAIPAECYTALAEMKRDVAENAPSIASRAASLSVLNAIADHAPTLIGGSADLTGSNCTITKTMQPITAENAAGNYLYYGIREHAMASAMNGLALYGFIPYGGTFLVFTDYCRPAIRLSALMGLRVIYVMTHDSIGLGEDGPTHQPVEHLAALRAIPNLCVLRPADIVETAECWEIALQREDGPSVLALSRQNLATLRTTHIPENKCALGGYIITENTPDKTPDIVLIATGSEVNIAADAYKILCDQSHAVRVVSVPCTELLEDQGSRYLETLIPEKAAHVVIEAGISQGWHRFVNKRARFLTVDRFGASAPKDDVYKEVGITVDAIVDAASAALSSLTLKPNA